MKSSSRATVPLMLHTVPSRTLGLGRIETAYTYQRIVGIDELRARQGSITAGMDYDPNQVEPTCLDVSPEFAKRATAFFRKFIADIAEPREAYSDAYNCHSFARAISGSLLSRNIRFGATLPPLTVIERGKKIDVSTDVLGLGERVVIGKSGNEPLHSTIGLGQDYPGQCIEVLSASGPLGLNTFSNLQEQYFDQDFFVR